MTNTIATANDISVCGVHLPLPLAAALISAIVAACVSGVIARFTIRSQRRQQIDGMITKLIEIAIQYPYLEDDTFAASWISADRTREQMQRYDNYCCFVFNLLEHMWKFHRGNAKKIDKWFYAQEMAVRHKHWWRTEIQNRPGYDLKKFHAYIDNMIGGPTGDTTSNTH